MEKEFENYNQEQSTDQSSEKHEGHQAQPSSYQRQFRPDGRPQRPRIQNQHNYVREEGFRPEGFGAGNDYRFKPRLRLPRGLAALLYASEPGTQVKEVSPSGPEAAAT